MSRLKDMYTRFRELIHEVLKFGMVGLVAYIVDVGLFNILHVGLELGPLWSKLISSAVSTCVAYVGNRFWSFSGREKQETGRQVTLFFVINGIGILISLIPLWFTVYILNMHGPLAANISGNVIGIALAMFFRFYTYHRWVFPRSMPVDKQIIETIDLGA